MKKTIAFFGGIFLLFALFVVSCNEEEKNNKKVKIIEERDPIVKIIEEKDSMVVYAGDSIKKIIPKQ